MLLEEYNDKIKQSVGLSYELHNFPNFKLKLFKNTCFFFMSKRNQRGPHVSKIDKYLLEVCIGGVAYNKGN